MLFNYLEKKPQGGYVTAVEKVTELEMGRIYGGKKSDKTHPRMQKQQRTRKQNTLISRFSMTEILSLYNFSQ